MKHATAYINSSTKQALKSPYEEITQNIIRAIEDGSAKYEMPWHQVGNPIPRNALTSKSYRGINVLSLWASALSKGYTEGEWATYRQWEELGCQVKRGERSSPIVFWDSYVEDTQDGEDTVSRSFAKRYNVFNCAQVEGFCRSPLPERHISPQNPQVEAFFAQLGSDIRIGGNDAGYSKSGDFIRIPKLEQFGESKGYYCVLAHEHVHWSGHESRLNRDLSGRFGDASYAMEELIAELGAAFLCPLIGVQSDPRTDHAGYVASWLNVLKKDNRAIFAAASAAQKAADYLVELAQADPVLHGSELETATRRVFGLSG